jgi:hypothetical protein
VSDLISAHAMPMTLPPPLTPHMRAHLLAGLRASLNSDRDQLARLPRNACGQQPARVGMLIDRIAATRTDIADLEAL